MELGAAAFDVCSSIAGAWVSDGIGWESDGVGQFILFG